MVSPILESATTVTSLVTVDNVSNPTDIDDFFVSGNQELLVHVVSYNEYDFASFSYLDKVRISYTGVDVIQWNTVTPISMNFMTCLGVHYDGEKFCLFLSDKKLYNATEGLYIYTSTNGQDWVLTSSKVLEKSSNSLFSTVCYAPNCYMVEVAESGGRRLYETTDGGVTFTVLPIQLQQPTGGFVLAKGNGITALQLAYSNTGSLNRLTTKRFLLVKEDASTVWRQVVVDGGADITPDWRWYRSREIRYYGEKEVLPNEGFLPPRTNISLSFSGGSVDEYTYNLDRLHDLWFDGDKFVCGLYSSNDCIGWAKRERTPNISFFPCVSGSSYASWNGGYNRDKWDFTIRHQYTQYISNGEIKFTPTPSGGGGGPILWI